MHGGFALSHLGESIFLYDQNTNRVDAISFGLQLPDYSIGRIGGDWQLTAPTPGVTNVAAAFVSTTNLAINEWVANSSSGQSDWIELYNRSATLPVRLNGIYLGTSNAVYRLTSLSYLSPHGYLQLFADELPGTDHLDFKLPAAGGVIILYDESGTEISRVTCSHQHKNFVIFGQFYSIQI